MTHSLGPIKTTMTADWYRSMRNTRHFRQTPRARRYIHLVKSAERIRLWVSWTRQKLEARQETRTSQPTGKVWRLSGKKMPGKLAQSVSWGFQIQLNEKKTRLEVMLDSLVGTWKKFSSPPRWCILKLPSKLSTSLKPSSHQRKSNPLLKARSFLRSLFRIVSSTRDKTAK